MKLGCYRWYDLEEWQMRNIMEYLYVSAYRAMLATEGRQWVLREYTWSSCGHPKASSCPWLQGAPPRSHQPADTPLLVRSVTYVHVQTTCVARIRKSTIILWKEGSIKKRKRKKKHYRKMKRKRRSEWTSGSTQTQKETKPISTC